jgi:DNA-binding transcriptional ArsR family regulator
LAVFAVTAICWGGALSYNDAQTKIASSADADITGENNINNTSEIDTLDNTNNNSQSSNDSNDNNDSNGSSDSNDSDSTEEGTSAADSESTNEDSDEGATQSDQQGQGASSDDENQEASQAPPNQEFSDLKMTEDTAGGGSDDTSSTDVSIAEGLLAGGGITLASFAIGAIYAEVFRIALLVGIFTPVLAARKKNREDMMTRGRLLGYLEANTGIHFSALRDALGLANGVTAYHLQVLESSGQIISWRDGKLRRYAVATLSEEEAKRIKNPIAGTRLAILETLAESGNLGLTGKEIRAKLAISRQLLSHHLTELRSSELVEAASLAKRPNWRLSLSGQDTLLISRQIARHEAV